MSGIKFGKVKNPKRHLLLGWKQEVCMDTGEDRQSIWQVISAFGTPVALLAAAVAVGAIGKAIATWILIAIALSCMALIYATLWAYPMIRRKGSLTDALNLPVGSKVERPNPNSPLAWQPFAVALAFWAAWVLAATQWPSIDRYLVHALVALVVVYVIALAYRILHWLRVRRAAERRSGYHRRSAETRKAKRHWRPRGVFRRE